MALSEFELAFYDWFNQSGSNTITIERQREIFQAGWEAARGNADA